MDRPGAGDGSREGMNRDRNPSRDSMVVVRRKRRKPSRQPTMAKLRKKVKVLYILLWAGLGVLALPFVSWVWLLASFNQRKDTFALITIKYACWVVSLFEITFLALSFIMGVLRLVTFKQKKVIKRIRLTADVTTGLFIAQLLVYIPLSGFMVTRFRARVYEQMQLTIKTTRDFEKRDDVWIATQSEYKCCGIEGPKNWNWGKATTMAMTKSCCSSDVKFCTKEKAYKTGCYEYEKSLMDLYFLIVGLPTLTFQLILIVLIFYGFDMYRTNSKKMRMQMASDKAKKLADSDAADNAEDSQSQLEDSDAQRAA